METLPDKQSPAWLGLPNNAENILLAKRGKELVRKLLRMQQLDDDDEIVDAAGENKTSKKESLEVDLRPAWMRSLADSAETWLASLPAQVSAAASSIPIYL